MKLRVLSIVLKPSQSLAKPVPFQIILVAQITKRNL
jgi:hypothetical protein